MVLIATMFFVGAGAVLAAYGLAAYLPSAFAARRLDRRLREVSAADLPELGHDTVVMRRNDGLLPALDRLAARTRAGSWLARLIEQSGARVSPSGVLMTAVALGGLAALLVTMFSRGAALPSGVFAACLPLFWLLRRRSVRVKRFEEQFPEALDLLSRAIRAGHAFQTAMGMMADELPDPIGPEFKRAFDQQNFGLPLKEALNAMAERVPLIDVHFFVTAVLIQRETGGNLSEILDNLASVVRERFKILRQVRVHTAHGRLTGYVLLALPAALGIVLSMLNPDHMNLLFREHMGQMMLAGAIVMQTIGYFWIRQVIKIEV